VRVALVGDQRPAVRAGLEAAEGVDLVGSPETEGDGEIPRLAASLRAFESLFEGQRVDRLVVVGSSDPSLAAVLVATKMLVPVAALESPDGDRDEAGAPRMNARLIEHLADAALADDEAALAAWLRDSQQPSQAPAEH
jgi:UDP-N-acetylglucosamine 2-epimerase